MLYHPPLTNYSGLTITLGNPSRFDEHKLLSGYAGQNFENLLHPISRHNCDIRLVGCNIPRRPDTRVNFILGDAALAAYNKEFTLNELRGNPFFTSDDGVVNVASYFPQDTYDRKDYESDDDADDNDAAETESAVKGHGRTKRRNWRWWLYADTCKVKRLLADGYRRPEVPSIFLMPELSNVIQVLNNCVDSVIYLDIEVDKYKNITCLGIMEENDGKVYVIPWKRYDGSLAYDYFVFCKFLQSLSKSFRFNRVVCHNASFDLLVMAFRYHIQFPLRPYDTMLAWHRLNPEIDKSLGHLISYYTDFPYHKSEGIYDPKSAQQENQLWMYNAKDIYTMRAVYLGQQKEIESLSGYFKASVLNVQEYIGPYLTMTMQGSRLDVPKLKDRYAKIKLKEAQLERCLKLITGKDLNPRSPQQVSEYFYTALQLECPNDNKPTNKQTLYRLYLKNQFPSVRLIPYIRATRKLASALAFRAWGDNKDRFTTTYRLAGTDTLRLASGALWKFKKDKGFGSNFQNWDKKQRDLIIADEGKILGQNDQAGAEALIVAYLCRNARFRSLFLNGIKPHSFVALHLFADGWIEKGYDAGVIKHLCTLEPSDLAKHPEWDKLKKLIASSDNWEPRERYYFIAKMVCHASNYGMKWPTFQMHLLTKSEGAIAMDARSCKEFLGMYHNLFPEIVEWHSEIQRVLREGRILYNLFNEPRRFIELFGDDLWKQGYAFRPQSTVGEITNRAIVGLNKEVRSGAIPREWGFDAMQNGHDSILWQSYESFKMDASRRVKFHLEPWLINDNGEKFQMKSEASLGYNWAPKSSKNPNGLEEVKL